LISCKQGTTIERGGGKENKTTFFEEAQSEREGQDETKIPATLWKGRRGKRNLARCSTKTLVSIFKADKKGGGKSN